MGLVLHECISFDSVTALSDGAAPVSRSRFCAQGVEREGGGGGAPCWGMVWRSPALGLRVWARNLGTFLPYRFYSRPKRTAPEHCYHVVIVSCIRALYLN